MLAWRRKQLWRSRSHRCSEATSNLFWQRRSIAVMVRSMRTGDRGQAWWTRFPFVVRHAGASLHPSSIVIADLCAACLLSTCFAASIRSPDGTHLLLQTDAHELEMYRLVTRGDKHNLDRVLTVCAPSPLLDVTWYPFAAYDQPATWCFVFSARDIPIRLVDAYSGRVSALVPFRLRTAL